MLNSFKQQHTVVLGFDFGITKIGMAVGQTITHSARPLSVLKAKNGVPDWMLIKRAINEWGVDALVVGLPLNMDGTEQPLTVRARQFAEALKQQCLLPMYLMDERLTTVAAREAMHSQLKGAARFEKADSVSAQFILESWFRS